MIYTLNIVKNVTYVSCESELRTVKLCLTGICVPEADFYCSNNITLNLEKQALYMKVLIELTTKKRTDLTDMLMGR